MSRARVFSGVAMATALMVLAGLSWLSAATARTTTTTSRTSGNDVVMLRCATSGAVFSIGAYQGSASSPTRRSESCPETLSLLKKDGFSIGSVSVFDQETDYLVFTLVR